MSGNPFGVVIPPDKGDANAAPCICVKCGPPWRTTTPEPCDLLGSIAWHSWMALCPECGSKRCPGATDHARHPLAPEAPTTPHTPASAPNTPPRVPEAPPNPSDPHRSNP